MCWSTNVAKQEVKDGDGFQGNAPSGCSVLGKTRGNRKERIKKMEDADEEKRERVREKYGKTRKEIDALIVGVASGTFATYSRSS